MKIVYWITGLLAASQLENFAKAVEIPQDSHFGQLDSNADAACEVMTLQNEALVRNPEGLKAWANRKGITPKRLAWDVCLNYQM